MLEQVRDAAPLPLTRAVSRILSVAYRHLIGGQVYAAGEIQDWLRQSGFRRIRRKSLLKAGSALITATA